MVLGINDANPFFFFFLPLSLATCELTEIQRTDWCIFARYNYQCDKHVPNKEKKKKKSMTLSLNLWHDTIIDRWILL